MKPIILYYPRTYLSNFTFRTNNNYLPEITNEVVLYEFFTLCTVLPSYESTKLTNLTAISRIFMSHSRPTKIT